MTPSPPRARPRRPIYVETRIRAPMDRVWDATQEPAHHQRWDVRFGSITYLPAVDGEPQRFTYATTVAPGVTVAGTGETLGDRDRPDGTRWSGLRFWAADRRSIIEAGAGYWRYIPTGDGVRFLTRYDYRPRWGRVGEVVDRWVFRPVFGWATAWSFDRLRLWLDEGIPPERARDRRRPRHRGGRLRRVAYQGCPRLEGRCARSHLAGPRRPAGPALVERRRRRGRRRHRRAPTSGGRSSSPAAMPPSPRRPADLTRPFNPVARSPSARGIARAGGRPRSRRAAPTASPTVGDLP